MTVIPVWGSGIGIWAAMASGVFRTFVWSPLPDEAFSRGDSRLAGTARWSYCTGGWRCVNGMTAGRAEFSGIWEFDDRNFLTEHGFEPPALKCPQHRRMRGQRLISYGRGRLVVRLCSTWALLEKADHIGGKTRRYVIRSYVTYVTGGYEIGDCGMLYR